MNNGSLRVKVKIDNSDVDRQLRLLKQKLLATQKELAEIEKLKSSGGYDKERVEKDLIKLKTKEISLNKQINNLQNQRLSGLKSISNTTGATVKKMLRWGMAILGVGSAFAIVSKAVNAFLAVNDNIRKKMDFAWQQLGSIFEPILNAMADKMLYLVAIIKQFAKAMGWASSNSKATAKAVTEIKKQTAGFDELNILQDTSLSSNQTGTSGMSLPTLSTETIANINKVANALKPIFTFFKDLVAFGLKNPELILKVLGGIAIFSFVAKLLGSTIGLSGLLGVATALSIIAGISIKNMLDQFNTLLTTLNKINEAEKTNIVTGQKLKEQLETAYSSGNMNENQKQAYIQFLSLINTELEKNNSTVKKGTLEWNTNMIEITKNKIKIKELQDSINGIKNKTVTITANTKMTSTSITDSIKGIYNPFINSVNSILGKIGFPKFPALATGGIINRPSTILAGERGKEAILPLTDRSAMSELGAIIGQYMSGSSGITNIYLDSRLIQRQIASRTEEVDFANNR